MIPVRGYTVDTLRNYNETKAMYFSDGVSNLVCYLLLDQERLDVCYCMLALTI